MANPNCVKEKLGTPANANTIREMRDKGVSRKRLLGELAFESYINNALGGISTQTLNVNANLFTAGMRVPESYMAAGLSKLYRDPALRRSYQASTAEAIGLYKGAINGFRYIKHRMVNLKTPRDEKVDPESTLRSLDLPTRLLNNNKLESTQRMWKAQTWELEGTLGFVADVFGGAVNLPGNLLNQADTFFKVMNYQATTYRELTQNGLNEGLEGADLGNYVQTNYTNMPEDVKLKAMQEAEYQTFTDAPENKVQQLVLSKEFNDSPLLKWVIPFRRTVVNVVKYGVQRTPVVGLMGRLGRDNEPGSLAVDMARQISGGLVMATGMYALKDNLHGLAPTNRQLRQVWEDDGFQEFTLQIGDTYFKLDQMGGFGEILKAVAMLKDDNSNTSFSKDVGIATADDPIVKTFMDYSHPFVNTMTNSHWVKNLSDFLDSLMTFAKYKDPKSLMYWFERTGVTAIPLLGNRSVTKEVVHRMNPEVQEYLNFGDYAKANIPLLANLQNSTATKFSMYGDPIMYRDFIGEGWINPVIDPLDDQGKISTVLQDLRVELSPLRKKANVSLHAGESASLEYTPEEWEALNVVAGKGLGNQPTLKDVLTKMIDSPRFAKLTEYRRKLIIEEKIGAYRSQARKFVKTSDSYTIESRRQELKRIQRKHLGAR